MLFFCDVTPTVPQGVTIHKTANITTHCHENPQTMYVYILCIMIKYPSYIINSIISLMNVTF